MLTFTYDLPLQQGASFDKTLTYKAGQPAVPVDFTGATAWLVIRLKNKDKTEALRLTTENGGIELGGAAGTVRILMTRAQTQKFVWAGTVQATYTLHIQYANAFVHRLMNGAAEVDPCND